MAVCDERGLQAEREPALKIVVMSATLDAAAFARFFGNANTVYLQVSASATLLPIHGIASIIR